MACPTCSRSLAKRGGVTGGGRYDCGNGGELGNLIWHAVEAASFLAGRRSGEERLAGGKFLSVSVVATPGLDDSIDDVAADYARCARWAVDSGADGVEANFSCPNVSSVDGQLYLNAADAGLVAARLRGDPG